MSSGQKEKAPGPGSKQSPRRAYRPDESAIWQIVAGAIASGVFVALYVLAVEHLNFTDPARTPVKSAALMAAEELRCIHVDHSSFGKVGLVDRTDHASIRASNIRSLGSLKASILVAAMVARKLGNSTMIEQVDQDLESLNTLESQLLDRLFASVAGDRQNRAAAQGEIYAAVRRYVKQSATNMELKRLSIELGRYDGPETVMTTPASPGSPSGHFPADIPIAASARHDVRFFRSAGETRLVDASKFKAAAPMVAPSAVLVTATFVSRTSTGKVMKLRKTSCATIGSDAIPPSHSCIVFRFPQGLPEKFETGAHLLRESGWYRDGEWEQANKGPVPGSGFLRPTIEPVLPAMSPGKALSISLYHWLRQTRPAPDPSIVLRLLSVPLKNRTETRPTESPPANSCLVVDTGARERAFIRGTGPRSEGQQALRSCFSFDTEETEFPEEAVPLTVDGDGNLALAARSSLEAPLIQKYLDSIYNTNIAALETIATADAVRRKVEGELRRMGNTILQKEQELTFLQARAARVKTEGSVQTSLSRLSGDLARLKERRSELTAVLNLTGRAKRTATRVGMRSFEISSRTFALLKGGLHQFDAPVRAFLLGRRQVFFPLTEAVTHQDFFQRARSPEGGGGRQPWFDPSTEILVDWHQAFKEGHQPTIDGKSMGAVVSEIETVKPWQPLTVVFDSADLARATVAAHRSSSYPFAGLPVPEAQNFFYCKSALRTGRQEEVEWSVAIRDAVCHHNQGSFGEPLKALDWDWGRKMKPPLPEDPGLAVEFQLRRPLPHLRSMPTGALITDPVYRRKIQQIPPVPASMM